MPLHKRGNRLYVATSDPANLQALDEVRFKTNLVVEPVVVEDDKLGVAIAKLVEASGANLKDMAALEDIEVTLEDGTAQPAQADEDSEVEDAPVVHYTQKVLIDAITTGATACKAAISRVLKDGEWPARISEITTRAPSPVARKNPISSVNPVCM